MTDLELEELDELDELELEEMAAEPQPPKPRPRGEDRRKSAVDRRCGLDRRQKTSEKADYTGPERRSSGERRGTGLERRRGPGRRRSDDRRTAEEGEMSEAQFEFIMAINTYKKVNKRLYPTWTEILEVVRQLGYRKVHAREIRLDGVPEAPLESCALSENAPRGEAKRMGSPGQE